MNRSEVQSNGFRLGTLALIAATISLFFNEAFSGLMGASDLTWLFAVIVLTVCGLDLIATYMERSWWPYMFYLAALLFSPTAIGLSKADWFSWFGFSNGVEVFRSQLPDTFCFFIGSVIVVGYLLSWGAERLGVVGKSLISQGANPDEVDGEIRKAFSYLSKSTGTLVLGAAAIWLLAGVVGGWLASSFAPVYLPITLVAGIVFVVLFYWAAMKGRDRRGKINDGTEQR
jgi:hypothetical protein